MPRLQYRPRLLVGGILLTTAMTMLADRLFGGVVSILTMGLGLAVLVSLMKEGKP